MTEAQTFRWDVPINACRLTPAEVKQLYKIIDDKQIEDRNAIVNHVLSQLPNETPAQFKARQDNVSDACVTTIISTGASGDKVAGHGEKFLDDVLDAGQKTIYFDTNTQFNPRPCFL